jgi:pimeloyl-ACP methyl ester carboxylesterase
MLKRIAAGALSVAYEEHGRSGGPPVLLLHGFPYDVRAYDDVAPVLAAAGCRVIIPFLRGFGPTRFVADDTPRTGQQAALAHDLTALMDALSIRRAVLAGYDWGGRAACIVAALWPERAAGLVSGGGYNIQDIKGAVSPQAPETEFRLWYQYYFHGERGRAGLERNRREFCKLLWRLWSPNWNFDAETYAQTAASFDNPDFVTVVIHSYRHRFGLAPGDPELEETERCLVTLPTIDVPTVALFGGGDGVTVPPASVGNAPRFKSAYEARLIPGVGHNLPQEAPSEFADAIVSLLPVERSGLS